MEKIAFKQKYIIFVVLIFAAVTRLVHLDYPNAYVFDEVYHAFTAKQYLVSSKDAWDPYAKPPEGVAFEWTHPPLAKEFMALSMKITNSQEGWAWRLPGVIFGIISVYLVYLLGMKLFKNNIASNIAAFAFSIDGLNFVQSRTGMNDIYFVTFMLSTILLLLYKKYFFSAIFLGLALSSKWAALYSYLIVLPFLLKGTYFKFILRILPIILQSRMYLAIILFLVIPTLVYLASYIPYFMLGFNIDEFIGLQQQMWWYHTGLKATHGYSSPWWSWPLNLYPVWYYVDYPDNKISNIFAIGNLSVFWMGSAALILSIWEVIKKRSISLFLVVLGFLVFWLPWAVSPRIMFLYHFSPSLPFLCLALGYQLNNLFESKNNNKLVIFLLLIMLANFTLVYPFLTGIPQVKSVVDLFFLTNLSKNPF